MGHSHELSKTEIAQGYDQIALQIGMSDGFYAALLAFAGQVPPPILDVGCGGGHLIGFLLERLRLPASVVHGVDISHRLCSLSREKTAAGVVQSDAEHLPFSDGQFRTAFMTEVLEHILAPQRAFEEIRRVLSSTGTWILTVPNRDWLRYHKYIQRKQRFQPVDDRFYRLAEIEELARQTGLTITSTGGYGSLRHGGPVWGALEQFAIRVHPALATKRKRLFVKLQKTSA